MHAPNSLRHCVNAPWTFSLQRSRQPKAKCWTQSMHLSLLFVPGLVFSRHHVFPFSRSSLQPALQVPRSVKGPTTHSSYLDQHSSAHLGSISLQKYFWALNSSWQVLTQSLKSSLASPIQLGSSEEQAKAEEAISTPPNKTATQNQNLLSFIWHPL